MPLRLQSKTFFLTFPQADFDLQGYVNFYKDLVDYILVSSELHEDGNLHRHALLIYKTRKDIRNERYFDYEGFHPNIQIPRNLAATKTYIKKDGTFLEEGTNKDDENIYELARTLDYETFMNHCIKRKVSFQFAKDALRRCVQTNTITAYTPHQGFKEPVFIPFPRPLTSLLLIGKTGIGKTTLVKIIAEKPSLWCTHLDTLKQFNPAEHKSIIFDDLSFQHLPRHTQLFLADRYDSRTIHIRYGTVDIPQYIPKYFTANEFPFIENDAAINRRLEIIQLLF